jgi:predicted RNA binding protein YcfA (HicA-like mRNA interferase family)
MAINYSHLRSLTARDLISALAGDRSQKTGDRRREAGAHQLYLHADGRRVTVSFHRPGETFEIKTLRTMMGIQAHWTDEDLKRLKLIR